jgi:hypothetical protein
MMKEFSVTGLWRFPGRRKEWAGALSYRPQYGASLELVGRAKDINDLVLSLRKGNEEGYQEIILGRSPTDSGDELLFTLHRCHIAKAVVCPGCKGSLRLSLDVNTVIRGKHFSKTQALKFKRLIVDFTHLFAWLNISGITSGINVEVQKPDLWKELGLDYRDYVAIYKRPQPINASISDNCTISLYFEKEIGQQLMWDAEEESRIKQRVYAMIEFTNKQSLGTFEDVCYHFRNFVSLGVARPVYPQEIKARLEGEYGRPEDIEFFIRRPHYSISDTRLPRTEMLFTYADISARFESYLSNWMKNSDRLKPVYDLYFGIIHNPSTYLIHNFLSLVQALETYHRRLEDKNKLTNDVIDALVQEVLKRPSNRYKKGTLKDRKKPPLIMRILELSKIHENALHPVIEFWQRVDFADFVTNARHYYSHLWPEKDSTAPTKDELWKANERMKFLLQACLLFEVGVSEDQIGDLFSKNGYFGKLVAILHTLSLQHVIHIPLYRL